MKGCSKPMDRVVVVIIKPWLGWARNDPHKFYVNATVFLESNIQDLHVFIYPSLIQGEKGKHLLLLHVDNL